MNDKHIINNEAVKDVDKFGYSKMFQIKEDQVDEIKKYVISISEASIEDGGAGAIIIKLKNL